MNKPLVTVLLALYNPNLSWLKEQLDSINSQTYENIELWVCDDCSSTVDETTINVLLKEQITRFPYKFLRNKINQGTNRTFELLTMQAYQSFCYFNNQNRIEETHYFAYCDQDDIWENNKIETLISSAINKNAVLAYSDMSIIDSDGKHVSDSIAKYRKRFRYYEGKGIWKRILVRNFISGCCMLVRADIAYKAVPFEYGMQHDRWLSFVASINGEIAFVNEPLVRYRQHDSNQTGVLKGITDKQSYIEIRLKKHMAMLKSLRNRMSEEREVQSFLNAYIDQVETRLKYASGKASTLIKMLGYIKYNIPTILFEIIALKMPDKIFKRLIRLIIERNL